jgi:hypothetical protein
LPNSFFDADLWSPAQVIAQLSDVAHIQPLVAEAGLIEAD